MVNRQLIDPKSIVIVGGSNDKSKVGGALIKNLTEHNFKGTIFAVNPKETEVQGFPCFKTVAEMPMVEMAIICVAAAYVKVTVKNLQTTKAVKRSSFFPQVSLKWEKKGTNFRTRFSKSSTRTMARWSDRIALVF